MVLARVGKVEPRCVLEVFSAISRNSAWSVDFGEYLRFGQSEADRPHDGAHDQQLSQRITPNIHIRQLVIHLLTPSVNK